MKTEIDAKTVKKLREETGAGMMNCKKALEEKGIKIESASLDFVPKEEIVNSLGNAIQGKSAYGGKHWYRGPLPPFGTHRYIFKVYVLDTTLNLSNDASKSELLKAMKEHILQYGTLTGKFSG